MTGGDRHPAGRFHRCTCRCPSPVLARSTKSESVRRGASVRLYPTSQNSATTRPCPATSARAWFAAAPATSSDPGSPQATPAHRTRTAARHGNARRPTRARFAPPMPRAHSRPGRGAPGVPDDAEPCLHQPQPQPAATGPVRIEPNDTPEPVQSPGSQFGVPPVCLAAAGGGRLATADDAGAPRMT